jgi:hypothetical protein
VTAALLLLLGLSAPLRAPDLQVEAATKMGADLPELADAVARALVAGGARVVLGGPTSEPCLYCAKIAVIQSGEGTCSIEVNQARHAASATLSFPPGSPLFDRARAIAIQARLLVTWETGPEAKAKDAAVRPASHKTERKVTADRSAGEQVVARSEPTTPVANETQPGGTDAQPEPTRGRTPDPLVSPERHTEAATPANNVERTGAKSVAQSDAKKPESGKARPERTLAVDVQPASAARPEKQWPWIPTLLGSGSAVAAGICAVVARSRYNALSDKSQPYASAQALKTGGQNWQVASIVFSGVAAVGLGAGLVGFATRAANHASVTAVAAPIPGGGLVAIAGELP